MRISAIHLGLTIMLLSTGLTVAACQTIDSTSDKPIVVGYLGGVSGRASSLGLPGRDGALFAVEETNRNGGVNGSDLVLEIADDGHGQEASVAGMHALARAGAVGVVGPATSVSAMAATPIANELGLTLVSSCVSTGDLSRIDDHFVRVYPDNRYTGATLTSVVVSGMGLKKIAVAYDLSNRSYTETQLRNFTEPARRAGASISTTLTFTSDQRTEYSDLAGRLVATRPDGIFLIANAIDTGMLCQHIRMLDKSITLFASPWSGTDDLISTGGSAVEGLLFLSTVDLGSEKPEYSMWREAFTKRFGYQPGFAALHSYEAMQCIIAALEQGADRDSLKSVLLRTKTQTGVQTTFAFDRFGDTLRPYYLTEVRSGAFVTVGEQ